MRRRLSVPSTRLVLVVSLALVSAACAWKSPTVTIPDEYAQEGVFWNQAGQLVYFGELNDGNNRTFFRTVDALHEPPGLLVVTSQGGEIGSGLEIGRWVHENEVTVRVVGLCASSCANYVFTGAARRQLHEDSILAWHGSAWQKSWDGKASAGNQALIDLRNQEASFFSEIGIDRRITTYGQDKVGLWDQFAAWLTRRPIQGFDHSVEDMAFFGLTNIELLNGRWDWRNENRSNNVLRIPVDPEDRKAPGLGP